MKLLFTTSNYSNKIRYLVVILLSLLIIENGRAQCSISAPDTVVKCFGQSYNLGTGVSVSGASGTVMYSWNGAAPSASPSKSVSPTITTTYLLNINDGVGCSESVSVTVKILPVPVVNAGVDESICVGENIQLCATASSANGAITLYNWIGGGGTNPCRTVSPSSQTVYTIYALDQAGCAATDNITVFVNPLPVVNAGNDVSMCLSQGSMQLTGTPFGGTWSGVGVTPGGLFTPGAPGNFILSYSYTNSNNCTKVDDVEVTVNSPSPIDGGLDLELCLNSSAVQLPSIGIWSGSPSVSPSGLFTPSSIGTHSLTVTNTSNGCPITDQVIIEVLPLPSVNAGMDVGICAGQCAQLNATASSSNGTIISSLWSGGSVTNNAILNPNACSASSATYTIQVTDNKNCSASDNMIVNVSNVPTVNAGSPLTVCTNSAPVQLTGQSPIGGTWSGAGVTASGVFTPGGLGNVSLTYSYTTGANCSASSTRTIHVVAPSAVNAGSDIELCLNSPSIQLLSSGTWSGSTWVTSSGVFTPGAIGNYQLTYSELIGQCVSTDQVQVSVLSLPVVNVGTNQTVCYGTTVNLSGSASSSNGPVNSFHWDQPVLNDQSIANPFFVAVDTLVFNLTVKDSKLCENTGSLMINVEPLPIVDAGNDISVCLDSDPVILIGYSPLGGTWSGIGVTSSGVFTPSTSGDVVLTYTYSNSNNCINSSSITVHVLDPGSANVGNDIEICHNALPIQLMSGGVWSGSPWVTSNGVFNPGAVGNFNLNYVEVVGGCNSTATLTVNVRPLPSVNAGTNQDVCIGATVNLNGSASSSNGSITSYYWSENIVGNQNIQNPSFSASNDVTLHLTATDIKGCTASDAVTIEVHSFPVVDAGNNISVCLNEQNINLNEATPIGGTWSGVGINGSGTYTITTSGVYTVTYTFSNSAGCTASDQLDITVETPDVVNGGADQQLCHNSSEIQLNTGGSWSGSNWVTSSGIFTPGSVGNYPLTYSVINGVCTSTDIVNIEVLSLPTAHAGVDTEICEGNSYNLSGSGTGGHGNYFYAWNNSTLLNDATLSNPVLTTNSTVTLELIVTDGNQCSAVDEVTITVVPLPIPSFYIPPQVCVNTPITITNGSTNAASYSWSFGNSSTSTVAQPTQTYSLSGTYTIVLSATNSAGCSVQTSEQIDIIGVPQSAFNLSTLQGCSPLHVDFQNASSGVDVSYLWSLGTSTSADFNPVGVDYEAIGETQNYSISLVASNSCGSTTYQENIMVFPQPIAQFDTLISTQCSPVVTHFINTSTGNPTSYLWEFGDGATSTAVQPIPRVYYANSIPEDFIVKLYAYNQCGQDLEQLILTVMPNTIQSVVTPSVVSGCSPVLVQFSNSTVGATDYYFNFGDGHTSTQHSPTHIFEDIGNFEVQYIANDGCSFDTLTIPIQILESPSIGISSSLDEACPEMELQLEALTGGQVQQVIWNFSDGNIFSGSGITHTFQNPDIYTIAATAVGTNGCEATASKWITIHPKPNADIQIDNDLGCSPWSICLTGNDLASTSYHWDFGNGISSNTQNSCSEYINTGNSIEDYTISLFVESSFGCIDSNTKVVHINPQPVSYFSMSSDESCYHDEPISVSHNSTGADTYAWYVDGSFISSLFSPTLHFSGVGEHTAKLISTNIFGCTDNHTENFTIHPSPFIDIMPSVFNGCSPLKILFENETTDATQYQWTYSDGQVSDVKVPQVTFDSPGFYSVQLTATSIFGCTSTNSYDDMIEVFESPEALFTLNSQEEVLYDTKVVFVNQSMGAMSYSWSFGDGSITEEQEPIHIYPTGGNYTVILIAKNDVGCTSTFEKTVRIDNTTYVIVPGSFTPNDDGINDVFRPSISSFDDIFHYSFEVINRWGEVVFQSNNPSDGWTGNTSSGDYYVHNDIFTWTITISFKEGKQPAERYKGTVMVLR